MCSKQRNDRAATLLRNQGLVLRYIAHSANAGGITEPVEEHLREVANLAAKFAGVFGAAEQAKAAGLLHDIGKYSERFLAYIEGRSEERAGNHSIAGALVALRYRRRGCVLSAVILGHHGGLTWLKTGWKHEARRLVQDLTSGKIPVTESDVGLLEQRFRDDGFVLPDNVDGFLPSGNVADDMLDTRMLFSTLVDADFLETEAHFEGDADQPRRYRPTSPSLQPERALAAVEAEVQRIRATSAADQQMDDSRATLFEVCRNTAEQDQAVFTLSAPTGSGKTLAMLAFALAHAARHHLRRVILVMPFLSIIDQTAQIYRRIFRDFPKNYILEDHSLARAPAEAGEPDLSADERLRRHIAENWDAPIVLTTNVRCLESLMSQRTSDCRKLHRMARSVLLFDEIQTLPKHLAVPTLGTLSRLHLRFDATVLFATATQPAFQHLDEKVRTISIEGWPARAVLKPETETRLFEIAARRTTVHWELDQPVELTDLAQRLADESSNQWLCIVNLKRHAQQLTQMLAEADREGLMHLSTAMCPAHRQHVLSQVVDRLQRNCPVRLVATQCVEAGVDIDLPVVYRALAPLEAITQAAGRCNRHGAKPQPGRLHVVKIREEDGRVVYPPGYESAPQLTQSYIDRMLADGATAESLLHEPRHLSRYFRDLYDMTGTGSGTSYAEGRLLEAMSSLDFVAVGEAYRLIEDNTVNVLVPYDETKYERLAAQIRQGEQRPGFLREWIRDARRLTVAPYPKKDWPLAQYLEPVYFGPNSDRQEREGKKPDWYLAQPGVEYDERIGLKETEEWQMIV